MNNLVLKAVGGLLYVFIAVAAMIFLPAWTLHYWQAWLFLAVFTVCLAAIFLYLAKYDPDLLARRVKTTEKENSQKVIRLLVNLAFTAALVVSSLDHRFAWSAVSFPAVFGGDAIVVLGLLIIFFVFRENTFTAQTVEVEAGQKVVSTGPYAFARHPMYVGGLVFICGIPPALGSWWGLLVIVPFLLALGWRILDEERVLVNQLAGYEEYRRKVRYRLIPFVW